jgi:hypothetical protein
VTRNDNNNTCGLNRVGVNFIVGVIFLAVSDPVRNRALYFRVKISEGEDYLSFPSSREGMHTYFEIPCTHM